MPAKNIIKKYQADSYYHIYNRGVEKRNIFNDEQDYAVFLNYLKEYLEPVKEDKLKNEMDKLSYHKRDRIVKKLNMNNFSSVIDLISFCLMPNHFHFLIKQKASDSIKSFTMSFFTRYVMYFNKRYKRVGSLFQSVYKGVLIKTEEQLLHLSRYIHQNPIALGYGGQKLLKYPYSSLGVYLSKQRVPWIKPEVILNHFSDINKNLSYQDFVLQTTSDIDKKILEPLLIENQSKHIIFN